MIETRSTRLVTFLILVTILCGLLIWAGTLGSDLDGNEFPDENEFAVDYTAYVGEQVEFSGTVLAIDPVIVEVTTDSGTSAELTLRSYDNTDRISESDEIVVYGILEAENKVSVVNTTSRQPWESHYMYLISFVAGLWTLGRFLRHWRLNCQTLSFTPQEVD